MSCYPRCYSSCQRVVEVLWIKLRPKSSNSSCTVIAHLNETKHFKYIYFNMTLALWYCLNIIIMKLGFRSESDGTKCIEFTVNLLSFCVEIKGRVHQVQVAMHNSVFQSIME